ncbi:galactokinase [Winogradskyella sp. DF17]|uniref:Galactokinase n=1 Tax=Winogradskyella pelagia TaxID=2819984 RepID=A0ABS3SYS9_9FLAO|nr:galactokinase [Winogradskyella sp. DF17]MBO3115643.1 galactokinase [Winogradskyella sp. DF17]
MLNPNTFDADITIHSPGRINLIGEHIDYNGGLVLPAAIDKRILLEFRKTSSEICTIFSSNYNSSFTFNINDVSRSDIEWQNYILGVIFHINLLKPNRIGGFDCIIESNLPLGSGISSSAALECGMAKGLNDLFSIGLSDIELITLSRDAEHNFVGTKCGIMDQFAVVKGKKDKLILLNCETLDYRLIEADFNPYQIVLLNTNVSHSLASSQYNVRRQECESALKTIKKSYPSYNNLVDIPPEIIAEFKTVLPQNIYNRALYVSQEQRRTLKAVSYLKAKDLIGFGWCLFQSHYGLQHLYEVSCKELDFLVDQARELDDVIGARMMGGGFGGCTINLVHKEKVKEFISEMTKSYRKQFNIDLSPIEISIGDGVKQL